MKDKIQIRADKNKEIENIIIDKCKELKLNMSKKHFE